MTFDVEKNEKNVGETLVVTESRSEGSLESHKPMFTRWKDSFKPAIVDFDTKGLTEGEIALKKLDAGKKSKLSARHTFIASMAGCVGTGLFIGSGNSLKIGGPAGLILGFVLMAIPVICFMFSMGEMGVRYRAPTFLNFIARFIDPSWGFAVSWSYGICWIIVMPLELIAAAMTISYWRTDDNAAAHVNPVAWVAIFYCCIAFTSFFGAKGYGEVEFVLSSIKVLATIGFIFFGIVVTAGGGPDHHYYGGHYFHEPGAFANGFKGVIYALTNCAFAYGGTELVGLVAARTPYPQRSFPSAVKQVFWRIGIFFITAVTLLACLVPSDNKMLGTASTGTASPFVIAIKNSGVRGLPSVFNAVIMISVYSVANASFFVSAQTLVALSFEGHAPKSFGYIDRHGRPLVAQVVVLVVGLLCFLAAYAKYNEVFNWLYAFTSMAFLFTWGSICVCLIRHRLAMKAKGIPLTDLLYKSPLGIPGAIVGAVICALTVIFQFWIGLWPVGSGPDAVAFFQNWLSVIVVIILFAGHKIYFRTPLIRANDVPITTGLIEYDLENLALDDERHEARKKSNVFYRVWSFWC